MWTKNLLGFVYFYHSFSSNGSIATSNSQSISNQEISPERYWQYIKPLEEFGVDAQTIRDVVAHIVSVEKHEKRNAFAFGNNLQKQEEQDIRNLSNKQSPANPVQSKRTALSAISSTSSNKFAISSSSKPTSSVILSSSKTIPSLQTKDNPYIVLPERLPLIVNGASIIDAKGSRVQLRCVNWAGGQLETGAVGGLNQQLLEDIPRIIRASHFNCVRLVYSLDLVFDSIPIKDPPNTLKANPQFWKDRADDEIIKAYDLFKLVIKELAKQELMIILNNHVSTAGWCCSNSDGNGLWYTDTYSEQAWLQHLSKLSKDFKSEPYVIGMDIRNEIRYANGIYPHWFSNNPSTDWGSAALKGGISVNMIAPEKLIIIGGNWYNMFLCDVGKLPVHEFIRNRIVYESHVYSWFSTGQIAGGVILVYLGTIVSLTLLAWLLFIVFGIIQHWKPSLSLTILLLRLEKWVLPNDSRLCRLCCSCFCCCGIGGGGHEEAEDETSDSESNDGAPMNESRSLTNIDEHNADDMTNSESSNASRRNRTPRNTNNRRKRRRSRSQKRQQRRRRNSKQSTTIWGCSDPLFMFAIISTFLFPLFVFLSTYLSGCTITLRIVSLVLVILGAVFGTVSAISWLLITFRFLVFTPAVRQRVLFGRRDMATVEGGALANSISLDNRDSNILGSSVVARVTNDINSDDANDISRNNANRTTGVNTSVNTEESHQELQQMNEQGTDENSNRMNANRMNIVHDIEAASSSSSVPSSIPSTTPGTSVDSLLPSIEEEERIKSEIKNKEDRQSGNSLIPNNERNNIQQDNTLETTSRNTSTIQDEEFAEMITRSTELLPTVPIVRSRVSIVLVVFLSAFCIVLHYIQAHLISYKSLVDELDDNWGFLVKNNIAPVWVGEFGASTLDSSSSYIWFTKVMRYLQERNLDWAYWPINGDTYPGSGEAFGLLEKDYLRYRDVTKLQMLSPLLNITVNATTGDAYPPGFGPPKVDQNHQVDGTQFRSIDKKFHHYLEQDTATFPIEINAI